MASIRPGRRCAVMATLASVACGVPILRPVEALAQSFPARPITLICPWPPGGGADVQMRALAIAAGKVFGQPVLIDNRPGVTGTLGPTLLLNARPDGYTLSQATNAVYRQPFITKTAYDPARDFTYVLGVTGFNFGLVVRADSPYRTVAALMEAARTAPARLTFGTFGNGSPPQTAVDRVAARHGAELIHVPFKGTADGIAALRGGHIDALADGTGWAPFVDSGQFRLLAVFGEKRLKRWPDVPTLKELGYDVSETSPWGIVGPAGIDPAIVTILHDGFRKAMDDPEFLKSLEVLVQEPMYMDTEAYRRYSLGQIPVQKAIVDKYKLSQH